MRVPTENQMRLMRECLEYDPDTGEMRWIKSTSSSVRAGDVVRGFDRQGYSQVGIGGRRWMTHRIAWFLYHGVWPDTGLDHENRVPSDNRIVNLRPGNKAENAVNAGIRSDNLSGYRDVCWHKKAQKWMAQSSSKNRVSYMGLYEDPAEAAVQVERFREENDGEFYCPPPYYTELFGVEIT